MAMKVLSFGEILFDIIEGEKYIGGAPLNFAAHAGKCGAQVSVVSKVGKDELGELALENVAKLGVRADYIGVDANHPTGTVKVSLQNGQPSYLINEPVAYDFIVCDTNEELSFDVFYFGTLAQRNECSRASLYSLLAELDVKHVFYDVNLRQHFYSEEILRGSFGFCNILKLNNEEVITISKLLYGEKLTIASFMEKISEEFAIPLIVVTAGALGCHVFDHGKISFVKGYSVKVADTVGAGDAFSAAFVYHYINHHNSLKAADIANQLGAFVASCNGPIPEYSSAIQGVISQFEVGL
jgi:fructokinase